MQAKGTIQFAEAIEAAEDGQQRIVPTRRNFNPDGQGISHAAPAITFRAEADELTEEQTPYGDDTVFAHYAVDAFDAGAQGV